MVSEDARLLATTRRDAWNGANVRHSRNTRNHDTAGGAWLVLGALAVCAASGGLVLPARAAEARYVGSFVRTEVESTDDSDFTQHRYDVTTRSALPTGADLSLRMTLDYQARPGLDNSDLLRSRFFGDAKGSTWRVQGHWVPPQDVSAGLRSPREQSSQLGMTWSPRQGPRLGVVLSEGSTETDLGRSNYHDRRADVSFNRGVFQSSAGYRRLESELEQSSVPSSTTQEWKAGLGFLHAGTLSYGAQYEYLLSQLRSAARVRDQDVHRIHATSGWRIRQNLQVTGSSVLRKGTVDDNADPTNRTIDEETYTARIGYRPFRPLDLSLSREYRETGAEMGRQITDYARFSSIFTRPLMRQVSFQAGYQRSFDLRDDASGVPSNTVFSQVDGQIRRGLAGRVEVRSSKAVSADAGRQWSRSFQLRGDPTRKSHVEVTWSRDSQARIEGQRQRDDEWILTGSYRPTLATSFTGTTRWGDGSGRLDRTERFSSFVASWRFSGTSQVSLNGSHRSADSVERTSREDVLGFDLQFQLPREFRVVSAVRSVDANDRPDVRTWSLSVEKTFGRSEG